MIIKEDKLFFIHIPKTAGTSIEKAINGENNPLWGRHFTFEKFCSYPKKYDPKDYFIFTVVRNPWDRIYSCFLFTKFLKKESTFWCNSFEEYLKFVESHDVKSNQTQHIINDFNYWAGGIENLDHVIRFENLESDIIPIKEYLGRDFAIPHTNANPIRDPKISYKLEYTRYGVDLIREKYRQEIELFDYSF